MLTGKIHRLSFCAVLVLAACSRGGAEEPSIVLERAASAARQLQSAAFDAAVSYETPKSSMAAALVGSLAEAGRQLSFALDGTITTETEGFDQTVSIGADVTVAGEGEAYVRLRRADGGILMLPGVGLVPQELLGRWFRTGGTTASGSGLTPDPGLIAMQTQVLTVTKDRSYEDVDGERCYAYDVILDRTKLLAFLERVARERGDPFEREQAIALLDAYDAEGTIWIDASTSVIRRVSWKFVSVGDAPHTRATLTLRFKNHNEPVTIVPPADASSLSDALPAANLPAL